MTTQEFLASTQSESAPPDAATDILQALWYAKRDEWDRAHSIAQDIGTRNGAWVHAHLHRVEGDESNAGYWYSRAGKRHSEKSLDDEWLEIADTLLNP